MTRRRTTALAYDHRWATYETDGGSRDLTEGEKADPGACALPRYWVAEWEVTLRTARAPGAVLAACRNRDEKGLNAALRT
jgi:hypothetical protein